MRCLPHNKRFAMNLLSPGQSLFRIILILISSWPLLSGCATLGKEECLNADWFTIGYEDGARGFAPSRIGEHREACAKHGIAPDFNRYEQGRLKGLREYCTPQRGYSLGAAGKTYNYICPDDLEPALLEAYRHGKDLYNAQMEVKKQKAELKKMQKDLAGTKQKLNDYETELVRDSSIGPKRRRYLLEEVKILTKEQQFIETEIIEQKDLLAASERYLHEIKEQNPY